MKDNRPVNLNLFTIKFPVTAIASILHRVSGVLLFLAIPLLIWLLEQSLGSQATFAHAQSIFTSVGAKLITWVVLSAMAYHLLAGVRHLLMDMGFAESIQGGRCASWTVIVLSVVLIVLLGYWLW